MQCSVLDSMKRNRRLMLRVRKLVDEVMYSEAGNEVLLIKHLS